MIRLLQAISTAVASGVYVSYLPTRMFPKGLRTGAGLLGTLWGLVALTWLPADPMRYLCVLVGVCLLSVAVSDIADRIWQSHDSPRIVIDEFAGYLCTMAFLPRTALYLVAGLVFFRVLDVWKPGWVRKAADLPGGWGVVCDDLLAGICANLILQTVRLITTRL